GAAGSGERRHPVGNHARAARLLPGGVPGRLRGDPGRPRGVARAGPPVRPAGGTAGALLMHVLFTHSGFPAQFGRLALELRKRYGWECTFLVESLSNCPPPSREMLSQLRVHRIPVPTALRNAPPPAWPQVYEE